MQDRSQPPAEFVAWLLAAPLLVSWGLGVVHPMLDVAAVPAAFGLALPAWLGWPGCLAIVLLALAGERSTRASLATGWLGGLSLLASAVAATRPLAWLLVLCAALGRRSDRDRFELSERALRWLGVLAWLAASRARPWGPGLLPESVEVALGRAMDAALPVHAGELAPVLAVAALAALMRGRAAPDLRGALVGGLLALAITTTFGGGRWWASAAAIGMVIGAWPPPFTLRPSRLAPALVVVLALCSLRLGATERWRCEAQELDRQVRRWPGSQDVASIGMVPGNLPFLLVLRDDGLRLERLSTTGVVAESVPSDLRRARLLSSTRGGGVALAARVDGHLRVERWQPSPLERLASEDLADPCEPVDGDVLHDGTVRVLCEDGRVLLVALDGGHREAPAARTLDLSGPFSLRGGPVGAVWFGWERVASAGPWATGIGPGPARLFIARGPAGQVEVRGSGPSLPGQTATTDPDEQLRVASRRRLDRIRTRGWPSRIGWTERQSAVWITSAVDGTATLADPGVVWHQARALVGPPPSQVVVDGSSGTLYGLNRCGVFEVTIRSTFPWPSSGDVEPAERPVEAPTGG